MKHAFVFIMIIALLSAYIIPATLNNDSDSQESATQFGTEVVFSDEMYDLIFNVERRCLDVFDITLEPSLEGETAKYLLTALTDEGITAYFEYSLRPNSSLPEKLGEQYSLILPAGEQTLIGEQLSSRSIQNNCSLQDVKVNYFTDSLDI